MKSVEGFGKTSPLAGSLSRLLTNGGLRRAVEIIALVVAVETIYVLVVSAGHIVTWPTYMDYYDLLAEGFRNGHLYLPVPPAPELLAQENPFDPQFSQYWLGDTSLYKGHYYLYWGPLPAVILAGFKTIFRISRSIGEQYLVFAFFSLWAVCGILILDRVRRVLFSTLPYYLFAASALALTLANPVLFLLASSSVYMSAISGGQAFLLLGAAIAIYAVTGSGRPSALCMLGIGLSWGLSLCCRVSLLPALCFLVPIAAFFAVTAARRTLGTFARNMALISLPLAICGCALLVYNHLRFDSWLESGVSMQLTTWKFRFDPRFYIPNLYTYAFRPMITSCRFPYFLVPYETPDVLPSWIPFQRGYMRPEPVAGFFWAAPCTWAMPIVAALIPRLVGCGRSDQPRSSFERSYNHRSVYLWCAATFAVMGTATGLAPLGLYLGTMRYLADVTSGLMLLGILGLWTLYSRYRDSPRSRRAVSACCLAICVGTTCLGLLLGYQGYTGHVRRFNPALSASLERSLSTCKVPPSSTP